MKKIKIYFLSLLMLSFSSCNDKLVIINCDECTTDEPKTANLKLLIEPETGNDVLIKVYRGLIEYNIPIDTIITSSTDYTYTVNVNTKYTFAAEYINYKFSGKTIIAVNSAYPRVRYDKQQCDNPCYYVYNTRVNLRVKYQ